MIQHKIDTINETLYNKLNKKLDTLRHNKNNSTHTHRKQNTQDTHKFYTHVKNLSNITFSTEETKILELGLNYAFKNRLNNSFRTSL
jgi:hypothetical protein